MGYIKSNLIGITGNYPKNFNTALQYIKSVANGFKSNYDLTSSVTPSLLVSDCSDGTFNPYYIKSDSRGDIPTYKKNNITSIITPAKIYFLVDENSGYNEMQSWIYEVGDYFFFFYADGDYEAYVERLPAVCALNYSADYNIAYIELNEETQTATLNKVFDTNIIAGSGMNTRNLFPFIYDRKLQRCYSTAYHNNYDYKWYIINSSVDSEGIATHTPTELTEFGTSSYIPTSGFAYETAIARSFYYSKNRKYIYVLMVLYGEDYIYKWVKIELSSSTRTTINEEIYDSEHYDGWPEDVENGEVTFCNEEFPECPNGSRTTELYYNAPNKLAFNRIFKQVNEWKQAALGLPEPNYMIHIENGTFMSGGGFSGNIYKTTDYWKNFDVVFTPESSSPMRSFSNLGDGVIIGMLTNGHLIISKDSGETWEESTQTLQDIQDIYGNSSGVFFGSGTYDSSVSKRSFDFGTTWSDLSGPVVARGPFTVFDNGIVVGSVRNTEYPYMNLNVARSTNFGDSFTQINVDSRYGACTGQYHIGNGIMFRTYGIFYMFPNTNMKRLIIARSTDYGASWQEVADFNDTNPADSFISCLEHVGNGVVLAGHYTLNTYYGGTPRLFRSEDFGATWVEQNSPDQLPWTFGITSLASTQDGVVFACSYTGGADRVWYSSDYGITWHRIPLENSYSETAYYLNTFDKSNVISATGYKTIDGETTYYQDIDYTLMEVKRIGLYKYGSAGYEQSFYSDWHDPLPFISVGDQTYLLVVKNGRDSEGEETHTLGFLNIDTRAFISTGRTSYDSTLYIYVAPDNSYALLAPDDLNPIMLFSNGDFSNTNYNYLFTIDTIERKKTLMCAYLVSSPFCPPVVIDYSPASPKIYAMDGYMTNFAQYKIYASLSEGYYIYNGNIGKLMLTDFDEDDEPRDFDIPSFDGYAGKAWIKWYTVDDMLGSSDLFEAPVIDSGVEADFDVFENLITDEQIVINTEEAQTLSNNIMLIDIWTGANKTGVQLISSTDYTLGDHDDTYGTYNSITFLTHNGETVYCTYLPWDKIGYISGYRLETTLKCAVLNKKNLTVSTYDTGKVFSRDYCFSSAYWRYYQTYKSLVFPNGNFDIKYLEDLLESIEIEDNFNCGAPIELGSYMNILNGSHMEVDNKIYNIGNYSYPLLEVPEDSIEWYFIRIDSDTTAVVYFDADKNIFGKDITGTSIRDISNIENIQYVAQGDSADFLIANSLPTVGFNINSRYAIIPLWDKKTFEGISNSMTQCYVYDKNYKSIISGGLFYSKMQNKTYYKPQIGLLGGSYNNEKDAVIINCYSNNEVSLDEQNISSNFYPPIILSGVVDGTFKQDTGTTISYNIGETPPYADKILFELPSDLEEEFKENSGIFGRVPAYFGLKGRAYLKSLWKNYGSGYLEIIDGEESGNTFEHYLRNKSILNSDSGIFLQKMDDERMSYYRHYIKMYLEIFNAFYLFENNIYGYNGDLELNIRTTATQNIWRYDNFHYNLPRRRTLVTANNKNYADFRHYYNPIRHTIYDMWYDKDRDYENKYSENVEDLIDIPILDLHDIDEDSLSWGIKKLVSTPEGCLFIFNGMKDILDEEKRELNRVLFDTLFKIYLLDGKDTAEKIFSNFNNKDSYTIYDVVYNQLYNYYVTDMHKTYLPNLSSEKYVTRKFAKMYNLVNTYLYWDKKFKI